jgi:hypothetical protein
VFRHHQHNRRLKLLLKRSHPGCECQGRPVDTCFVNPESDDKRVFWVLGIYRRPPYNYEDLADLAARLPRT